MLPPIGLTHSAGRGLPAKATQLPLVAFPPLSPTRCRPPKLRPSTISGSASVSVDRQSDVGETVASNRGPRDRRTRGYRHPTPSSLASARSRPPTHPALDAGFAPAGTHTRNPESPPHKSG